MKTPEEMAEIIKRAAMTTAQQNGFIHIDKAAPRIWSAICSTLDAAGYVIIRNEPPPGWSDWAWRDLLIQMTCFPPAAKKPTPPRWPDECAEDLTNQGAAAQTKESPPTG